MPMIFLKRLKGARELDKKAYIAALSILLRLSFMDKRLKTSLITVAQFYDRRMVGDGGPLGFRRSTDLKMLLACVDRLLHERLINPDQSLFLDLGCADGRVNVFLSYLVKLSVGIELDEWTLEEYAPLRCKLEGVLKKQGLLSPRKNVFLFHGDSMDDKVHQTIIQDTGVGFEEFDLFYTYLVLHEEFAELIAKRAKPGAIFLVYGLNNILPSYAGFSHLSHISPMEGILALYRKD
jgi:SAM-dependent methyltransferase